MTRITLVGLASVLLALLPSSLVLAQDTARVNRVPREEGESRRCPYRGGHGPAIDSGGGRRLSSADGSQGRPEAAVAAGRIPACALPSCSQPGEAAYSGS